MIATQTNRTDVDYEMDSWIQCRYISDVTKYQLLETNLQTEEMACLQRQTHWTLMYGIPNTCPSLTGKIAATRARQLRTFSNSLSPLQTAIAQTIPHLLVFRIGDGR